MNTSKEPCPCCSGNAYETCCKPYHKGKIPKTALELMRSRYSAYALNLPEYIIQTTHAASPHYLSDTASWKRDLSNFSLHSRFQKLIIHDHKENETFAVVSFTAFISQEDRDTTFTETSYFEKINERWFYRFGHLTEGHNPNLITTEQLKLLPLAYYGDSILRRKGEPIVEITNELRKLVDEMIETMIACKGVGLAAPQVHHSIRLFVIRTPIENGEGGYDLGPIKVFINPKLSQPSKETWKVSEGCLSIPTIRADVERPKEITVEYTSLEGKIVQERVSGWQARVIMHENDHINGVLFVDRLNEQEKLKLAPLLKNLEKRIHDDRAL